MVDILPSGIVAAFGKWHFRALVTNVEFCLLRLKLMSRDEYDMGVTVFEIAFTWLSISIGYIDNA